MEEIIKHLFIVRDATHSLHLKTRSFAVHVALQEFYEGLVGLIDQLAETYQGQYGPLNLDGQAPAVVTSEQDLLRDFVGWLSDERAVHIDNTNAHLGNIWDEITALAYRTKYKIENLS